MAKKPAKIVPMIPNRRFHALISGSFEPYLGLYINAEETSIQELMEKIKMQKDNLEDDGSSVLQGSTDLFYFYKQSIVRCTRLSVRKPFLDLSRLFGKYLGVYADFLTSKLSGEAEFKKPLNTLDVKLVALILNTAEYCFATSEQMEEKIKEKIDPTLADKVDLSIQKESFNKLLADSTNCLVQGLLWACSNGFSMMVKQSWSNVDNVGDQSKYVNDIGINLTTRMNVLKQTLSPKHFKNFCNKFVEAFSLRLLSNIYKCKPISEVGAEQMLLDTQAIKSAVLDIGSTKGEPPQQTFSRFVTKEMQKAENVIKVLLNPADPPDSLVDTYIHLMANSDVTKFQALLDLKGLRRNEQQSVLEVFRSHLPSTPSGDQPITQSAPSNMNAFTTSLSNFPQAFNNVPQAIDNAFKPDKLKNMVNKTINVNQFMNKLQLRPNSQASGGGSSSNTAGAPPAPPPPPPRN